MAKRTVKGDKRQQGVSSEEPAQHGSNAKRTVGVKRKKERREREMEEIKKDTI